MKSFLIALFAVSSLSISPAFAALIETNIDAPNYILIDADSGQIIAAKDPDRQVEPASTTKLMSAYLVFKALRDKRLDLHQTLRVSETVWRKPGSSMFLDPRMSVPVEDLIKGMLVQSGNDATNLLAETLGGSSDGFVRQMNSEAQLLGMSNSSFHNPEGLPTQGHLSTAHDLALLGIHILRDFPEYAHFFSIKNYYYPGTPASNSTNSNLLLFRDPTVEGLKTGRTDSAGFCIVAAASRNVAGYGKRRLVAAVLGTATSKIRADETQKLLNWGFQYTRPLRISLAGSGYETVKVWKGSKSALRAGIAETTVAVPSGAASPVEFHYQVPKNLTAPIKVGENIGTLRISLNDRTLKEVPMVALEDIEEANFLARLWDSLMLFFKSLL